MSERKSWDCLREAEIKRIKNKNCKDCKYQWYNGWRIAGCNYSVITGRCRLCDPRDCRQLGYYKNGSKIKRKISSYGMQIIN